MSKFAEASLEATRALHQRRTIPHNPESDIEGRLLAPGRVHDLLMQVSWAGAGLATIIHNAPKAVSDRKPYSSVGLHEFASPSERARYPSRKDRLPVFLHVNNCPASNGCFVQRLVELSDLRLSVVGIFALGVGMVDESHESRARTGRRPLQHL